MVLIGIPGPLIGIGFGCILNSLLISSLIVCSGKFLGDIIAYFIVKFYISPFFDEKDLT
jgi:uncharacterized membrane protein YdjX (TVP38/TMEM64 family)